MDNYIEVTHENSSKIGRELLLKRGTIIIPDSSLRSEIVGFYLLGNAQIYNDRTWGECINIKTWHKDNREYTLRRRIPSKDAVWEEAYLLFDNLKLKDGWSFQISGTSCSSRGLFDDAGKTLYIPKSKDYSKSLEEVLRFTILEQVKRVNVLPYVKKSEIDDNDMNSILKYIFEDLKEGSVMKHNTEAGMKADAMVGF